jgi:hypothetical protein
MKCKNCGHPLRRNYGQLKHHKGHGNLCFCDWKVGSDTQKRFTKLCGCSNPEPEASRGEKANSRTPSASEDVRSLSHLARRDSRESPRNPESFETLIPEILGDSPHKKKKEGK